MKTDSTTVLADTARVENQLVTFQLGDEEFGFNIMSVQEIIRPPKLAKVPRTPDYVDGVANLRGVVLPVIDTRTRFGMKREIDTDRTRVLVIDIDGVKTGLRVDRVRQVTRVASGDIEPPPSAIRGMSTDFLDGVVKLDNGKRIIMALKPSEVCRIQVNKSDVAASSAAKAEPVKDAPAHAREEMVQMVTFKLAREEFAFPIDRVREILRVEKPKVVPDTPDYILGVLTVRGRLLPIIDLRGLLHQSSLAEDLIAKCITVRTGYESWARQLKGHLSGNGNGRLDLSAAETLKEWLNAFTSSNQTLMETMAQVRGLNDRTIKAIQHLAQIPAGEERLGWFDHEVQPLTANALDLMHRLESQVQDNITEDQRIIVVDSNGILLGLVVDHVNEVLNIPKECIDPPPRIACADGLELSGIAKLDKGGRLIMLLDASQILKDNKLHDMQKIGDSSSASVVGNKTHSQHGTRATDEQQLVTFLLGNEEYGIPISQIQEIDRCGQITKVPKAAHFVEGVTNLRGEVIPVIDTRKRFDLPARQADDRTRVIIVDMGGVKTGMLVDSVREVLNISRSDIAPPPAAIESGIDNRFISGIGKVNAGKRMVVLLDVEKILSCKEQKALHEMASTPKK